MSSGGFSRAGLAALDEAMAGHVAAGEAPGLVLAVSRGDDEHVVAVGDSLAPDTIFRITSMTRPVTAVATLLLVDEGRLALDEPVDRLLPELAGRRVLRQPDGPLDNTVAAARAITVRDLLSFRGGFGMILAPVADYPILQAEQDLGLCSVGPPTPASVHPPDEWLFRMGTLPLMDQPGDQWRYSTGSMILGVLIARAAGQAVETFYRERIFEPLGMNDTGFWVPDAEHHRLGPCLVDADGALVPFDDGGTWWRPRPFLDCGAGLVATVRDYLAFARMLLHDGGDLVSPELVAEMTTDQLTSGQREAAGPILDGRGWGFGVSLLDRGYGWSGGYGTHWVNDPDQDLVAVLCHRVLLTGRTATLEADFWTATYAAGEA